MQFNRQLTISAAGSRKATHWPAQSIWWSELVERLRTAVRGTETLAEYLAMPKSKQDDLKDVGGFVAGELIGGRRKTSAVVGRDVITLDLDALPAGSTSDVQRRLDGLGCAYAVYSTRKHEEARPRLRVLIPLNRTVTADEYEPLARKLAQIIGIDLCDPTTFQATRLMYWPSCSADSQYVFTFGDKPFVDAEGLLGMYTDWRNVSEWPQVPGAQQVHVRMAAKQGDPAVKDGIVGAFCRQYDVLAAMEKFLPGLYASTDDGTGRFTYVGASTSGGAVIYDNGAFLYSHHATDPCGGRLVNAFDLVRLHRFGDADDEAAAGTPTNRLPSFTAMVAFALQDGGVATAINQERYDKAAAAFGAPVADLVAGDPDWIKKLEISTTTGRPAKTTDNILVILEHDPMIRGKLAYDEFAVRGLTLGALPWDQRPERRQWTDIDDAGLRHYLERSYGITGKEKILDAVALCAHKHTFNEVQEWLKSLQWDGVRRLDLLLTDYLGAADSTYTRAVSRKAVVAGVARAMAPGCKYDQMPILAGPQGLGKSTFLRLLGRSWYSDSLTTFEGKEASELIQGIWLNEVGELNGFSKSETGAIKQFLSRTEDIYREPYGRRTKAYPRRGVFWGTTNDSEFLKDATGNRRFWPVDVGVQQPTKSVFGLLEEEVPQIYAEAYMYWQLGEPLYLTGEAEEQAQAQQEIHRESNAKEGVIREFVERLVPTDWDKRTLAERRMYWSGEFGRAEGEAIERSRVCAAEVWCECYGSDLKFMKRYDAMEINGILSRLQGWKRYGSSFRFGPYGQQKGFVKSSTLSVNFQ
ncbi:virulence-associated E family protein [Paenibacillus curdlanolyticus YK9]|uniref:Virulence-associated E family protein n=1 Tax=Paenibacillus curdlanolyticus YK9 TaxID=717606 RepID=E0IBS1_9BACL|nr:virulence-associated E family protein [Paenibacillus curdlanolyticus]EFM10151.1 virulence-associated E family protein [Paenibacillus curdlanolyticus YK9]